MDFIHSNLCDIFFGAVLSKLNGIDEWFMVEMHRKRKKKQKKKKNTYFVLKYTKAGMDEDGRSVGRTNVCETNKFSENNKRYDTIDIVGITQSISQL